MTALPARNLLGDETSPYLLQHKDNPVHWRPWSGEALAEARALDKPIFLSSGYAACHWCHVMSHESFENDEIAAYLNEHFVCIKIDREERPDLDHIYQTAAGTLGQTGGWPLSAFLTPEGKTFAAGTYFPPEERFGKPPFRKVLSDVVNVYANDREKVTDTAGKVQEQLERVWATDTPKALNPNIIDAIARRLTQRVDLFFGGMEGAPKFPQPPIFSLIWRAYMRSALAPFGNAVINTMDQICQGGLYDHLGGGFSRYSTDERWLVPHFEKMLYDNAGLIELLTLVWQHTRSPLYATRVDETVDWLLREMVTKDGAFASSLDADSEGEEGKYYVWSAAEIDEILGPNEAPFFKQVYSVTSEGGWEGKNILHRLAAPGFLRPDQEAVLTRNRRMLLMARAKRVRPGFDDKVLADWNGMTIAALVQAGAVFKKADWHFAAIRAFWAIAELLGDGNKLHHSYRDKRGRDETTADGYGQMARAALLLYEVTADTRYLDKAKEWVERLNTAFADNHRGGYFFSTADATDLLIRVKTSVELQTANYNGVITEVLARLYFVTGEMDYRERAVATIASAGPDIEKQGLGCPTMLNAMEFTVNAVQVVIIGDDRNPETQALVRAVLDRSVATRIMMLMRPGQKLPAKHPAFGKTMEGGKPTAYICVGQTCSAPITQPVALANSLLSPAFVQIAQAQLRQQQAQQQGQPGWPPAANTR
jgi:uncharacterized protein YyaL (SSP411 family)